MVARRHVLSPVLSPGAVHVWHARTDEVWADGARARRVLAWLDAAERQRYDRYRLPLDREMFLLGRAAARTLVGRALGVAPTAWSWREGPRGRPEVAGETGHVRFNLAHSAGVVVCALACDRDVGVDIEDRQRRRVDPNIVRRFCAPAEIADIERRGDGWHERFLEYWTLKEAYLKARGLGIAVHLSDVSFTLTADGPKVGFLNSLEGTDARWAFALSTIGDRHLVATAAPNIPLIDGAPPTFVVEPLPPELWP